MLGITTLHNCMILSTLRISSHGFALGFPKRPHTNGDVFLFPKLANVGLPPNMHGIWGLDVIYFCAIKDFVAVFA